MPHPILLEAPNIWAICSPIQGLPMSRGIIWTFWTVFGKHTLKKRKKRDIRTGVTGHWMRFTFPIIQPRSIAYWWNLVPVIKLFRNLPCRYTTKMNTNVLPAGITEVRKPIMFVTWLTSFRCIMQQPIRCPIIIPLEECSVPPITIGLLIF